MNTSIAILASFIIILLTGTVWIIFRIYSKRLSRMNEELQDIKVMLNELPKNTSLEEYMFAQDQRLSDIGEKLDAHTDTEWLQQYIKDQANQIIAVISTHDEPRNIGVTRVEHEKSLQITNGLLERVLWSLRFDEEKYVENTDKYRDRLGKKGKKNINKDTNSANAGKDKDDNISMKSIMTDSDDSYGAMLNYMQQTGKSGTEALHALESARLMRNR